MFTPVLPLAVAAFFLPCYEIAKQQGDEKTKNCHLKDAAFMYHQNPSLCSLFVAKNGVLHVWTFMGFYNKVSI